jgi:hypothetical protein
MRVSEWIDLVVFAFLAALAWMRGLPVRRRVIVCGFAAVAIAATLLVAVAGPPVLRDWLPAALVLMVYWQAGQFFTSPDEKLQKKLLAMDRRIVLPLASRLSVSRPGRLLLASWELAYLFCYPMVPAAFGALYLLHARGQTDRFWTTVLASTYACYLMVPFIQTLPPRSLAWAEAYDPVAGPIRRFNLWILRGASIQMNTFPSAHVASSLASALVILTISIPAGLTFLAIAVGIAFGAVVGRYHYAADAILGAAIAVAAALALS